LEEYRKHLESQQIDFLERKLKNLELIRKEQEECQVKVTVSLDDINSVKKQLNNLQQIRTLMTEDKKQES